MTEAPPGEGGSIQGGRHVARNSAWLIGQPLALNVISIGSTAFIARTIGPTGFATFNIGMAFALMFAPLTNMGLRALTVRHLAQNREGERVYLGTVLALRLVLAMVAFGMVMLAAPLGSDSQATRNVASVAAFVLLFNTVVGVLSDGFHAREDMGRPARAAMVGGLVLTIASVIAVASGGGPTALALTYLLGPAINAVILWHYAGQIGIRPTLTWNPPEFRRLLAEALPFFGQGLLDSFSGRLDLFLLARTVGEANLGGYTAATGLLGRAAIVVDGSATALLPSLARLRTTNPEQATPLMRTMLLWLMALTLPLAVGIAIAAPEIMSLLYGSKYLDGAPVLAIACFTLPLTAAAVVLGHGLFVVHRNRLVVGTSMASTSATTAMLIPATLTLGLTGAPIARVCGRLLLVILRTPAALREYGKVWRWNDSKRLILLTATIGVPAATARLLGGGVELMLAAGALGSTLYFFTMWRLGMVPDALQERAVGFLRSWVRRR